MIVFSPHYDDAVFSCGAMLAERDDFPLIVTACTDVPDAPLCTEYDRACGFATSTDAMAERHREDMRAALVLGCVKEFGLGWYDQQYAQPIAQSQRELAVDRRIRNVSATVLAPLGIQHPDHRALSDAVLVAWGALAEPPPLWLYEDLPYRVAFPEFTAERLAAVREFHTLERLPDMPSDHDLKAIAVACYRSQLPAPGPGRASLFVPERFWKVTR